MHCFASYDIVYNLEKMMHLIGDFLPCVDSLAPISVFTHCVVPEKPSLAIRID